MRRRKGQITLFIILGIAMIIVFIFLFSTRENVEVKKTEKSTTKTLLSDSELAPIKTYVERSLRKSTDDVLFNKSEIEDIYRLSGYESKFVEYPVGGIKYPALYDSKCTPDSCPGGEFYNESVNVVEEKISEKVAVEFERILDLSVFENVYEITESDIGPKNVNVTINIGSEDVELKNYSIVLTKKDSDGKLDAFKANIPIRLGLIYENVTMNLLQSIATYEFYTPGAEEYDLSEHCEEIVPGGCMNNSNTVSKIVSVDPYEGIGSQEDKQGIIIIEDNRTRQYPGGFNLTFGLSNVNVTGWCECGGGPIAGYTLTTEVYPVGWGDITANPDKFIYDVDEEVMLTAVPAEWYMFDNWDGDASGNDNPITIIMDDDKSVQAHFVEDFIVPPFNIKHNEEVVATFSDRGNIVLKGGCISGGECTAPAGSFVIKEVGDTVAYVDDGGNLCIEDGDCSDKDSDCDDAGESSFVIKSGDQTVIYINGVGDLCLIGTLVENGNPQLE